jgi:hypothetical protein
VLDGRAAEFERDVPFGVIVDALNDYLGGLERHVLRSLDEDALAELASVFPSLSPYADGATSRGLDSKSVPDPIRDPVAPRAACQPPAGGHVSLSPMRMGRAQSDEARSRGPQRAHCQWSEHEPLGVHLAHAEHEGRQQPDDPELHPASPANARDVDLHTSYYRAS